MTGIGGFDIGALQAEVFTSHAGLEIDSYRANVIQANMPTADIMNVSLADIHPEDLEPMDWFHTSPSCKGSSVANKHQARHAWLDWMTAEQTIQILHWHTPPVFTLENVTPYAKRIEFLGYEQWVHQNKVANPRQRLTDMGYPTNIVDQFATPEYLGILGTLESLGYSVVWKSVNMAYYGVPQRRRRLVLVATQHAEASLPKPDTRELCWGCVFPSNYGFPGKKDIANRNWNLMDTVQLSNGAVYMIDERNTLPNRKGGRKLNARRFDEPALVITETVWKGPPVVWVAGSGREAYTMGIREVARLQTFPSWYKFGGNTRKDMEGVGNAVPPAFAKRLVEHVANIMGWQSCQVKY